MRTGVRIVEDKSLPVLINSIVIKAAEELWQDKLLRREPRWRLVLAGGCKRTRVTLSVIRRAIRGVKCALPEVLQRRHSQDRKLLFYLSLIRSNVP